MSWHYQIRRRKLPREKEHLEQPYAYEIVEAFGDITPEGFKQFGETINAIAPYGDTKEELIRDLEMMLADAVKYHILEEDTSQ